jgi:3-oxoacyl-[acyl-carrier protein] reductase
MKERTVFVVNAGVDVGSALSRGLLSLGHRVALLADGDRPGPPGAEAVRCSFDSRAVLEQGFMQAAARCGPPAQVVVSVLPLPAVEACRTHEMSLSHWHAACRDAIKGLLYTLQAAFAQFGDRGGSVVAIGPALSLPGAERLLALSAGAEGQRALVKSAARQWGRRGVTVNWVAAAPRALSPLFDALPLPVKPDAVMVALGRGPSLDDGLAGVVAFLGSPAGRALTGVTLMADGGEWMVP